MKSMKTGGQNIPKTSSTSYSIFNHVVRFFSIGTILADTRARAKSSIEKADFILNELKNDDKDECLSNTKNTPG